MHWFYLDKAKSIKGPFTVDEILMKSYAHEISSETPLSQNGESWKFLKHTKGFGREEIARYQYPQNIHLQSDGYHFCCPSCGKEYRVNDESLKSNMGETFSCPQCKALLLCPIPKDFFDEQINNIKEKSIPSDPPKASQNIDLFQNENSNRVVNDDTPKQNIPPDTIPNANDIIITDNNIRFSCPNCGQHYDAEIAFLNQTIDCGACHQKFAVQGEMQYAKPTQATPNAEEIASQPQNNDFEEILDGNIICPHCWQNFSFDQVHYISAHPKLVGDKILGDMAQMRFNPQNYNANGIALDSEGMECREMACPRCHLRLPSTLTDVESDFISLVGAPSSGKSYYLTLATRRLRKELYQYTGISCSDADPIINETLSNYENILFLAEDESKVVTLPKTQQMGSGFSSQVFLNGVTIDLPKPFVYLLQNNHPDSSQTFSRNLIVYDNAGEHFQPGADGVLNPATLHLVHSNALIFLFDPTADAQWRRACNKNDPQIQRHQKVTDQCLFCAEIISRIRKYRNLRVNEHIDIPLYVCVGKYDLWHELLPFNIREIPPFKKNKESLSFNLDLSTIKAVSYEIRTLLMKYSAEIVNTLEGFFSNVVYIPTTNYATYAEEDEQGGIGIKPQNIDPSWVEVPWLLFLAEKKYIKYEEKGRPVYCNENEEILTPSHSNIDDDFISLSLQNGDFVKLPYGYAGDIIRIENQWYQVPEFEGFHHPKTNHIDDDFWNS